MDLLTLINELKRENYLRPRVITLHKDKTTLWEITSIELKILALDATIMVELEDGSEIEVPPGDFFTIPPNTFYRIGAAQKTARYLAAA